MSVSLPARQYDLAAALLAAAVNNSTRTGTPVAKALTQAATARGRRRSANGPGPKQARGRAAAHLSTPPSPCSTSQGYEPRGKATRSCSPTARSTPSSTSSATLCAA